MSLSFLESGSKVNCAQTLWQLLESKACDLNFTQRTEKAAETLVAAGKGAKLPDQSSEKDKFYPS